MGCGTSKPTAAESYIRHISISPMLSSERVNNVDINPITVSSLDKPPAQQLPHLDNSGSHDSLRVHVDFKGAKTIETEDYPVEDSKAIVPVTTTLDSDVILNEDMDESTPETDLKSVGKTRAMQRVNSGMMPTGAHVEEIETKDEDSAEDRDVLQMNRLIAKSLSSGNTKSIVSVRGSVVSGKSGKIHFAF